MLEGQKLLDEYNQTKRSSPLKTSLLAVPDKMADLKNEKDQTQAINPSKLQATANNIDSLLTNLAADSSVVNVSTADEFRSALSNYNIHNINLNNNINFDSNENLIIHSNSGVKTINGKSHTIKFAGDNTWSPDIAMSFSDVNILTTSGYSSFNVNASSFDFTNSNLTNVKFRGVNQTITLNENCNLVNTTVDTGNNSRLNFKGNINVDINQVDDSIISLAGYEVFKDANVQYNVEVPSSKFEFKGNLWIDKNANFKLNTKGSVNFGFEPVLYLKDNASVSIVSDREITSNTTRPFQEAGKNVKFKVKSNSQVPSFNFQNVDSPKLVELDSAQGFSPSANILSASVSGQNIGYVINKASGEPNAWVIRNGNNVDLTDFSKDPESIWQSNNSITPASEILLKGKANKVYNIAVPPRKTLQEIAGSSKITRWAFGTDVYNNLPYTDAGQYDATAQANIHDGQLNLDKNGLVSYKDTETQAPATPNVTSIAWLPNTVIDASGNEVKGGYVTDANGSLNTDANVPAGAMGQALIRVTYSDGTYDDVPVQISKASYVAKSGPEVNSGSTLSSAKASDYVQLNGNLATDTTATATWKNPDQDILWNNDQPISANVVINYTYNGKADGQQVVAVTLNAKKLSDQVSDNHTLTINTHVNDSDIEPTITSGWNFTNNGTDQSSNISNIKLPVSLNTAGLHNNVSVAVTFADGSTSNISASITVAGASAKNQTNNLTYKSAPTAAQAQNAVTDTLAGYNPTYSWVRNDGSALQASDYSSDNLPSILAVKISFSDGTYQLVRNVPVHFVKDSEKYANNVTVHDLTTHYAGSLNASSSVTIAGTTPTSVTWKTTPNTNLALNNSGSATSSAVVIITFADGSSLEKTINYTAVGAIAGAKQSFENGHELTSDDAASAINASAISNYQYHLNWSDDPNGNSNLASGYNAINDNKQLYVVVNYSDGTKQVVPVTVDFKSASAWYKDVSVSINTHAVDEPVSDSQAIGNYAVTNNGSALASGEVTSVVWTNPVELTAGTSSKSVTLTFKDGSTKNVNAQVNVASASAKKQSLDLNTNESLPNAASEVNTSSVASFILAISWSINGINDASKAQLAALTAQSTKGQNPKQVYLLVKYADGTKQTFKVAVNVSSIADQAADMPEAYDSSVKVLTGVTPQASEIVSVPADLQNGASYAWVSAPTVLGNKASGQVRVTFSDGSTKTQNVTYKVINQASAKANLSFDESGANSLQNGAVAKDKLLNFASDIDQTNVTKVVVSGLQSNSNGLVSGQQNIALKVYLDPSVKTDGSAAVSSDINGKYYTVKMTIKVLSQADHANDPSDPDYIGVKQGVKAIEGYSPAASELLTKTDQVKQASWNPAISGQTGSGIITVTLNDGSTITRKASYTIVKKAAALSDLKFNENGQKDGVSSVTIANGNDQGKDLLNLNKVDQNEITGYSVSGLSYSDYGLTRGSQTATVTVALKDDVLTPNDSHSYTVSVPLTIINQSNHYSVELNEDNQGILTHVNAPSIDMANLPIRFKYTDANGKTQYETLSQVGSASWTSIQPDLSKISDSSYQVTITYKDGTTTNFILPVKVVGAIGQDQTYNHQNVVPDASKAITNASVISQFKPSYSWMKKNGSSFQAMTANDFNQRSEGEQVYVQVSYSDGTKQYVPIKLIIKGDNDIYQNDVHVAQDGIATHVNAPSSDYDASKAITIDKLPVGVTYTIAWNDGQTPDVSANNLTNGAKTEIKQAKISFTSQGVTTYLFENVKVKVVGGYAGDIQSIGSSNLPAASQAQKAIANNDALTKYNASYEWYEDNNGKHGSAMTAAYTKINSASATKPAWILIKYNKDGQADGEQWVKVDLKISNEAFTNDPQAQTIEKHWKDPLTQKDAEDAITNKADLKNVKSIAWQNAPTTNVVHTPANIEGVIEVSYSDGTFDLVKANIHITSDADRYNPAVRPVVVGPNNKPQDPNDSGNPTPGVGPNTVPAGTKTEWPTDPNGKPIVPNDRIPDHPTQIVVKYPDGSAKTITTTVLDTRKDNEKYKPNFVPVVIPKNETGTKLEGEAAKAVSNLTDLPENTKVIWTTKPDTTKVGLSQGAVQVTYPDRSSAIQAIPVYILDPSDGSVTLDDGSQVVIHGAKGLKEHKTTGQNIVKASDGIDSLDIIAIDKNGKLNVQHAASLSFKHNEKQYYVSAKWANNSVFDTDVKQYQNGYASSMNVEHQILVLISQARTNTKLRAASESYETKVTMTSDVYGIKTKANSDKTEITPEDVIDHQDLDKLPDDKKIASMKFLIQDGKEQQSLALKEGASLPYTARISFVDGSHLDVKAAVTNPASSFDNIEPEKQVKQDLIFTAPDGHKVLDVFNAFKGAEGAKLSASELVAAIKEFMPEGWKLDPGFIISDQIRSDNPVYVSVVKTGEDKNTDQENNSKNDVGHKANNEKHNSENSKQIGYDKSASQNLTTKFNASKLDQRFTLNNSRINGQIKDQGRSAKTAIKKLPQTGSQNSLAAAIGALLSGLGLIGLAGTRKKKDDK